MLCSTLLLGPGVPWRLHTWLESLHRAQQLCRDRVVVSLLTEFPSIRTEDYSPELLSTGLPLMFRMLETSKVHPNASLSADGVDRRFPQSFSELKHGSLILESDLNTLCF